MPQASLRPPNAPGRIQMSLHETAGRIGFTRVLGTIACVLMLSFAAPHPLPAQDTAESVTPYEQGVGWFSQDKRYHFVLSAAGAGGLYAAGRAVGLGRWPSAVGAAFIMGTVGVLREVYDGDDPNLVTRGKFSRKDMVWNGAGIVVGISVSEIVRRIR